MELTNVHLFMKLLTEYARAQGLDNLVEEEKKNLVKALCKQAEKDMEDATQNNVTIPINAAPFVPPMSPIMLGPAKSPRSFILDPFSFVTSATASTTEEEEELPPLDEDEDPFQP